MPQFFAQSKLFKASSYRNLRARLIAGRIGTGSSENPVLSKYANGSRGFPRANTNAPGVEYLELQELPRAHTVEGRSSVFGGDNDSSMGIAKTTTFDVISGSNPERHGEP